MSAELIGVIAVITVAIIFDYQNGFHDAANAIATSVSTRALTPRAALALAAIGIAGEVLRARNEERVLSVAFPAYAAYAEQTPRFVPRFPRCRRPVSHRYVG